jgi:ABC-2 type transport system permease protein
LRRGARLGPLWQTVSLLNPVVDLISGLRWAFYGAADVHIAVSTGMTLAFLAACLAVVWWVFKTGWRIRR